MNWRDIQTWKKSLVSTFICLLGCSIGTMAVSLYLINYHWFFVLPVSLVAGFISCMLFMLAWEIVFHKMSFQEAVQHSYKMSIVTILIMIISENSILLFIAPRFLSHQMEMHASHNFKMMFFAMSCGFLLSLPYNYYQLQKSGTSHH